VRDREDVAVRKVARRSVGYQRSEVVAGVNRRQRRQRDDA
jgi:hypothetical protein